MPSDDGAGGKAATRMLSKQELSFSVGLSCGSWMSHKSSNRWPNSASGLDFALPGGLSINQCSLSTPFDRPPLSLSLMAHLPPLLLPMKDSIFNRLHEEVEVIGGREGEISGLEAWSEESARVGCGQVETNPRKTPLWLSSTPFYHKNYKNFRFLSKTGAAFPCLAPYNNLTCTKIHLTNWAMNIRLYLFTISTLTKLNTIRWKPNSIL